MAASAKFTVRVAKKSRRSFSTKSGAETFIKKLVAVVGIDPAEVTIDNNETGEVLRPEVTA